MSAGRHFLLFLSISLGRVVDVVPSPKIVINLPGTNTYTSSYFIIRIHSFEFEILDMFLVANYSRYNLKCPYVCMSETFWAKRDFLSSYKR